MKKYILGVIAIFAVVVFSAFSDTTSKKAVKIPLVFIFTGNPGQELDPDRYELKETQAFECTEEMGNLCEIKAEPIDADATIVRPDLSTVQESSFKN